MKNIVIFTLLLLASNAFASYHFSATNYGNSGGGGSGTSMRYYNSDLDKDRYEFKRDDAASAHIESLRSRLESMSYSPSDTTKRLESGVKDLKGALERRNDVREKVKEMDHPEIRQTYVEMSSDSLRAAREELLARNFESFDGLMSLASVALDIATSFTPGVSWMRDCYEAYTGRDLIDGNELDAMDRGFAYAGMVSCGFGSKAKAVAKIAKGKHAASILKVGEEAIALAKKSADELGKFLSKLNHYERIPHIKGVSKVKAAENGWNKNNKLKTKNGGRDIYTDKDGTHWGLDTQHGEWEKFHSKSGKHEGAYDFDMKFKKDSIIPDRYIEI